MPKNNLPTILAIDGTWDDFIESLIDTVHIDAMYFNPHNEDDFQDTIKMLTANQYTYVLIYESEYYKEEDKGSDDSGK